MTGHAIAAVVLGILAIALAVCAAPIAGWFARRGSKPWRPDADYAADHAEIVAARRARIAQYAATDGDWIARVDRLIDDIRREEADREADDR